MKVFLYLRKSSEAEEQQEQSIPRQREECRAYCARKGYEAIEEFVESVSGSKDQDRRTEFNRMLLAIATGTEAKVIVCWNRFRFGRLDAYDAALGVNICRKNGVILDTVREGEFDWNDSGNRWKDYALSEAGKLLSQGLSVETLSGRMRALNAGHWPNGAVPYGYDRCYVAKDGTQTIIPRSVPTSRPKGTYLRLVVNPDEAAVVRELFSDFAHRDISLRALTQRLNERRVPPPATVQKRTLRNQTGNHGWNCDTVKHLLKIKAYIGVSSIGMSRRPKKKDFFNRAVPTEVENACPVLVDRETFDAVQSKFARRSAEHRKPHTNKAGTLAGFAYCGHCSFRLKTRRQKGHVYYVCESGVKRPHFGCRQWSIREDVLLPKVTTFVSENVERHLVESQTAAPPETVTNVDVLKAEANKLRTKIDKAEDAILEADRTLVPALSKKLVKLKSELDELERRIALEDAFRGTSNDEKFREWWEQNKAGFVNVPVGGSPAETPPWTARNKARAVNVPVDWSPGAAPPDRVTTVVPLDAEIFRGIMDTLRIRVEIFWAQEKTRFAQVSDIRIGNSLNDGINTIPHWIPHIRFAGSAL